MNPAHADVLEKLSKLSLSGKTPLLTELRGYYTYAARLLANDIGEDERIRLIRRYKIRAATVVTVMNANSVAENHVTVVDSNGWFIKLSQSGLLATGMMVSMEAINPANETQRDTVLFR